VKRVDIEEFVDDPVGRFVAGRTFVHFCWAPDFFGSILTGSPDGSEMRELGRAHDAQIRQGLPHRSLFDGSRLEAVGAGAYEALSGAWMERRELNRLIRQQAIVVPRGMAGATLNGYRRFSPLKFPTRTFDDVDDALAWLELPELVATVEALAAELSEQGRFVRALRQQLLRAPRSTLRQASQTLGLSERSVQRQLAAAGLTFCAERGDARIETAKRLLVETDLKVTAIAREIGFASSHHFSTLFRRLTGATPNAWRERARG
jgi:AraC-like DNA-binding protein